MKEMYNNYDEEEEDWDKPEVNNNMLYTWIHSLSPFFEQKLEISDVFLPSGKPDVADFVKNHRKIQYKSHCLVPFGLKELGIL